MPPNVIGGGAGPAAPLGGMQPGKGTILNSTAKPATGSNSSSTDPYGADPKTVGSEESLDSLGAYARDCFTQAKNSRTIVDTLLLECLRQRRGEYDAAELATILGRSTSDLPTEMRRPAVHADDLVAV